MGKKKIKRKKSKKHTVHLLGFNCRNYPQHDLTIPRELVSERKLDMPTKKLFWIDFLGMDINNN